MKVETYTNANGSNMDIIEYADDLTTEQIADDLRKRCDNWDYALAWHDDEKPVIINK